MNLIVGKEYWAIVAKKKSADYSKGEIIDAGKKSELINHDLLEGDGYELVKIGVGLV
jgi:hypothetical protein